VLNSDLIEHIEITPDTVITMTNGQKFVVLESTEQVIERVIAFRRTVEGAREFSDPARPADGAGHRGGVGHDAEGIR
jgi:flagellar protein FlbD